MRKKLFKYLLNKYAITFLAFFFYLLFVSDNDLFTQYKNVRSLNQLEQEKEDLANTIIANKAKLMELSTNMESLEKFARENYRMKKSNEVIYVIVGAN